MLRMLKLLPDQVGSMWHVIRPAIENALPPTALPSANRASMILAALLRDALSCFVLYKQEESRTVLGVLVTQVLEQVDSEHKVLFVYTLYGTGLATGKDWLTLISLIKDYARSSGCSHISALSKVDSVIKMMQILGADTEYRLMTLEV